MATAILRVFLHGGAAYIMGWGYNNLHTTFLDTLIRGQAGGHSQFLTIQTLGIAFLAMMTGLLCDLMPTVQDLKYLKRTLTMLALLLSIVVSSIYWSLVTLAPNLILRSDPGSTEPSSTGPSLIRIPLSLDLALHASPVISLLIDLFAFEAPYSKWETKYSAPAVASVFGVWYAFWVERCAGINKSWPYPFLENPFPIRVAIYAAVCTVAVLSFQGVAGLHRSLYGGRPSETTKGKTKKQA